MYLARKPQDFKPVNTLVRLYSLARKTHYEVLNLRRNCSDKEIKQAFIQMSKEYHPDKNKDAKAQEKFVRIVEAYNILGKPGSRAQYDNTVVIPSSNVSASYVYRTHVPYNLRKNPNYSYYYQSTDNNSSSSKEKAGNNWYYGFSGVKKLPNYYIIFMCCGVAFIGVMIQLLVIRNMYAVQRTKAQERSMLLAEELNRVRAAAKDNGNELQTRLLLDKIVSAANPTVTTASLGQALASENKVAHPCIICSTFLRCCCFCCLRIARVGSETLLTDFGISEPEEWFDAQDDMKDHNLEVLFDTW